MWKDSQPNLSSFSLCVIPITLSQSSSPNHRVFLFCWHRHHHPISTFGSHRTSSSTQKVAADAAQAAALARYLGSSGALEWNTLKQQLVVAGEALGTDELGACVRALTGLDDLPEVS